MDIRAAIFLILNSIPVLCYGQGLNILVSPTLETGFSIKSSPQIERSGLDNISVEPLSKMGEMSYIPVIYGIGLYINNGSKNYYGFSVNYTEVMNGYRFSTFKTPDFSSNINYTLVTGFARLNYNISYRRRIIKNERDRGYFSVDFGFSKNISDIPDVNYKSSNQLSWSDSIDANSVRRTGYSLILAYGFPVMSKKDVPLFHIVLKYGQGFRTINKGYFRIWDTNNNYINILSSSYGSQISIGIIKDFTFQIKK